MSVKNVVFLLAIISVNMSFGHTTQDGGDDDNNPLLDMASIFIQEALSNENNNNDVREGGGGDGVGLAGLASVVGSFMQANSGGGGKSSGSSGAMQILAGLGSLLASGGNNKAERGGGGGFDPSIIGNVIEMFTQSEDIEEDNKNKHQHHKQKRVSEPGIDLGSILQIASAFMGQNNEAPAPHHQQKRSINTNSATQQPQEGNSILSILPLIMQTISSFAGPEGHNTQEKHKDHAWVLPPFLEHLHVLWDHFSNSDLADALYEKSGVNKIMKGFKGRDGKLDYEKLFESLNNQSFRRRWIKSATLYLADWASYLANPEVYKKYFQTAQVMFNSFLKAQGYPKTTLFDPSRPSETLSNLLDYVFKHHLNVKIDSRQYVKPAVNYVKDLMTLGQARGVLQFDATDISDKLTDTLNLEVIEPILKVHRAYRYIVNQPHCDRYVLCQLNDPEQYSAEEARGLISGVSPKIVKVGSMGAAFFISTETGTPFWTLFNVITSASDCVVKYPVDCTGFHEGEAKVTTEYVHNEL